MMDIKQMKSEWSPILGIEVITHPPTVHDDFRGTYVEIFNHDFYEKDGKQWYVQDDISVSSRGVLRGIHGDNETWKLISCLYGKFYLVVVNMDKDSDRFMKWEAFTLSDTNHHQVIVPPKHGNGHLVLSETAIFHYKQSTYYDRAKQFTIKWDDPALNIFWPIKNPILSERDSSL